MKIAVISLFLPSGIRGGVPAQVHLLSNELAKRGHDVHVYSIFGATPDARYTVHRVDVGAPWRKLVRRLLGAAMLVWPWYVAREDLSDYDVTWAVGDSHFLRTPPPVVRTFHSTALAESMHATSFRRALGMLMVYPFELVAALRATKRVFVSKAAARALRPFRGVVIPNAVDLSLFVPGRKADHPTVLFVAGTMRGRKRGELLMRAFAEHVRPTLRDAELWMVCSEKIVDGDGIRWFGQVTDRRLAELYGAAWVFCLPSSYEGFGVPYIEAMASGTAVVATPNEGAREVLREGLDGDVVRPHDLGPAICVLLLDPERRSTLVARGLERAQHFGVAHVVDGYEALLVSSARASRGDQRS